MSCEDASGRASSELVTIATSRQHSCTPHMVLSDGPRYRIKACRTVLYVTVIVVRKSRRNDVKKHSWTYIGSSALSLSCSLVGVIASYLGLPSGGDYYV
jgi:hypothetical protein